MNIVEHNDALATKKTSEVERYLLRIIQRYFDLYNTDNLNSIEAIVVESLTRMKREIMHEKSFVFDINGVAGHVTLTASDIGGEPAFSKNTAFNKDFTPAGMPVADTICEGNDPRLSDKRTPNPHNHNRYDNFIDRDGVPIVDINGKLLFRSPKGLLLNDLLDQCDIVSNDANHTHANLTNVLDKLRYTGPRTEIDLAYLESTKRTVLEKAIVVDALCNGFSKRVTVALAGLDLAEQKRQEYSDWATAFAKLPPTWYDDAIKYVDTTVKGFEDYCKKCIDETVTKAEFQDFIEESEKYLHSLSNDFVETPIINAPVNIQGEDVSISQSIQLGTSTDPIKTVDAYFKYDIEQGGSVITVSVPLPFVSIETDSTFIKIQCVWTNTEAKVNIDVKGKIPSRFTGNPVYNNESIIFTGSYGDVAPVLSSRIDQCGIDSQIKHDFIEQNIAINDKCLINGYRDYDTGNWYYTKNDGSSAPLYLQWANGEPNRDVIDMNCPILMYLLNDYTMKIEVDPYCGNISDDDYLFEYFLPTISSYYKNARISYKIYVGEGDNNGPNS